MDKRALLLSPSHGLGGGIERYVQALEWAFAAEGIQCSRIDLLRSGPAAHLKLLGAARARLDRLDEPARIVLAHRALLPVGSLLARHPAASGLSVILHGTDAWGGRRGPRWRAERRLLSRDSVRAVAASGFTAGTMIQACLVSVLPPGVSRAWFDQLVDASAEPSGKTEGFRLATAFRLPDWRDKGLAQIIDAVAALNRPDVCLTVCGTGQVPREMHQLARRYTWCTVLPDLADRDLASQLAAADLFVLATRTRTGPRPTGEGFGLVLLESQIAGTPVVAPAFGGSHVAFIEGVTGVAPADESASALARVLHGLIADRARLHQMSSDAALWARRAFDPDAYSRLVIERLL